MEMKLKCFSLSTESLSTRHRATALTPDQVAEFIKSIGLEQYVENFREADMSGGMLLEASDGDLEEIGVESRLHRVKIITLFKRLAFGRTAPWLVQYNIHIIYVA